LIIGLDDAGDTPDREILERSLASLAEPSSEPLYLVLIGHGTFDNKTARFNLRGPDVSSGELAGWIKPIPRPVAIVNCASASGPFLTELSGPDRVVITATRSGSEYNFARFGDYLSSAMTDPKADLDKDDQTSLLEAYLLASARVREFYASEARLATEHSLIDDNGDSLGTPADWFKGVRAIKSARDGAAADGLRSAQMVLVRSENESRLSAETRARRDQLEEELERLRRQKAEMAEEEYLGRLESILLALGELYDVDATEPSSTE
jgi:hypothetical protein